MRLFAQRISDNLTGTILSTAPRARGGLYRLQSLYKMDAWDIGVNQRHLAQRNRQSKPADGVALEMVEEAMVASR